MSAGYDVIVVGAGVNGLVAASYLARAKKRVLLVEAENHLDGMCERVVFGNSYRAPAIAHALYALDPKVVSDLKLARAGLKFAVRDMPLVALRHDGKHLVLDRKARAAAHAVAVHSRADAEAWPLFRREMLSLARALRRLWWNGEMQTLPPEVERLRRQSLAAWLDSHFECDALKAGLAADAAALSPLVPGGALLTVWRAAQEMCGSQGAVAFPFGGPAALIAALTKSAKASGVEFRTGARVADFVVNENTIAGATLAGGESIAAKQVIANISRRQLLATSAGRAALGIAEAAALEGGEPAVASAKVLLALNAPPVFGGVAVPLRGRFIIAEKIETYVAAHAAARTGRLPDELAMEFVFPSAADPAFAPIGQHVVSVHVRPLPRHVEGGWDMAKAKLAAAAAAALERFAHGLAKHVVAVQVLTPDDIAGRYGAEDEFGGPVSIERLLGDYRARIATPIRGLYLCGASVEPLGAVSGRAARIAAAEALRGEARR